MKYLDEKLKKKYMPNFRGVMVHSARVNYSTWGEHSIIFNYYLSREDPFYNDMVQTSEAYFTNKVEALSFMRDVNSGKSFLDEKTIEIWK